MAEIGENFTVADLDHEKSEFHYFLTGNDFFRSVVPFINSKTQKMNRYSNYNFNRRFDFMTDFFITPIYGAKRRFSYFNDNEFFGPKYS